MPQYNSPGVYVEELPSQVQPIPGAGTSTAGFIGLVTADVKMPVIAGKIAEEHYALAKELEPQLVTSWWGFKKNFGDDIQEGNKVLASAVYGFFDNGGTRCWVARVTDLVKTGGDKVQAALAHFEAIDEIAIVAVPIPTDLGVKPPPASGGQSSASGGQAQDSQSRRGEIRKLVLDHCEKMENRFAILDGEEEVADFNTKTIYPNDGTSLHGYGAVYFPHIYIGKAADYIPPSGHIAGIYARVDSDRGIYKAPANEVIRGVQGLKYRLSRAQQDGLNPQGINVIRQFNGNNIKVWGARTLSDPSSEYKYINVRRTMLFLRKSIDEGTQWAVFEPNNPALWQKIKRNVSDFLTVQWRSGALFGNTVQEAFYVQCDAETNPPEERNLGRVNAVVGVAIVQPAEFIIFTISQTTIPT